MPLSFAQAAQQIGLHKSNLLRVITAGRVSALRDDSGSRRIDESEPVCSATIRMAAYRQLNWPNRAVVE
jgi:hypothetical protein